MTGKIGKVVQGRTLREQLVTEGATWAKDGGEGLRFLMEPSSSPLGGDLRQKILKRFPKAKFYAHAQLNHDNAIQGAERYRLPMMPSISTPFFTFVARSAITP